MTLKSALVLFSFILFWSCQSQETHHCQFENSLTVKHDQCGYVEVPNNWSNKTKGTTSIAYIVIKSVSQTRKNDPVIFVQGGPGGNVLPLANLYSNLVIDSDRDFILYDQRGIGFSNAICPNLSATFIDVMAKDIVLKDEDETLLEVSSDCIKSLKDEKFKMVFGTTESAKDLEALRKHLSYKQFNLFGGSYGTRLSMKYMELYPNSVRSAILSGLFPPEIRLYDNIFTNLNRSLEKLFTTCEETINCKTKYPDLRSNFESICKELNNNPKTFIIDGKEFVINKQDFLLLLQQLLYHRQTISQTPSFILAFKNNDHNIIAQSIQAFSARLSVINVAAYWSITVPDEAPFNNTKKLGEDVAKYPHLSSGISLFSSDPEVMKKWPVNSGKTTPMIALKSDIPTLLVSGDWDPITPPSNADKAAQSLSNSHHVVFPNDGHCPINSCFFTMAKLFINTPSQKVDDSCIKASKSIQFN